jgi:hypothetical protein
MTRCKTSREEATLWRPSHRDFDPGKQSGGSVTHSVHESIVAMRLIDGRGLPHDVSLDTEVDTFLAAASGAPCRLSYASHTSLNGAADRKSDAWSACIEASWPCSVCQVRVSSHHLHALAYATTALYAGKEDLCQAEPSCLTSYIPHALCAG